MCREILVGKRSADVPHVATITRDSVGRTRILLSAINRDWNPLGIIFLAKALWLIDPGPQWPPAMIDALASSKYWMGRQEAADALSGIRFPAAVDALIKALDDDEPLVRCSAARALLATYGLPPEPMTPQAMCIRVMSHDAAKPRPPSTTFSPPSPGAACCRREGGRIVANSGT